MIDIKTSRELTQNFVKECIKKGNRNSHETLSLMQQTIQSCQVTMLCMMASFTKKENAALFYKNAAEMSLSGINVLIANPEMLRSCPSPNAEDGRSGEAIPEIISILKGLQI